MRQLRKLEFVVASLAMLAWPAAAWAQEAMPGLKKLDGPSRAKALAALAGLIILGFGMIALIWLGARVTQRYRNSKPYFRPTPRPGEHDWAGKPLVDPAAEDE
jgi:hypothetical protein